jgi:hypothetical protein
MLHAVFKRFHIQSRTITAMTESTSTQRVKQRRILRERVDFLERWHVALMSSAFIHAPDQMAEGKTSTLSTIYRVPRDTAIHHLQQDYCILIAMQELYASLRLNRILRTGIASKPLYQSPSNKQQNMLIRAFHEDSHSRYEEQLGFTCSGLEQCNPYHNFDDLLQNGIIQEHNLRNHCGGAFRSLFISASDDPTWLLQFVRKIWAIRDPATISIAFIRADILTDLRIPYVRSDDLVKKLKAQPWHPYEQPDGVQYTHDAHWLIYGWVPPQAVYRIVSLHDFDQACSQAKARANKGMHSC